MSIKGIEKFRKKLPGFQWNRIYRLLLLVLVTLLVGLTIMSISFLLPRLYPSNNILATLEPIIPIFGILICVSLGSLSIFNVWHKKEKLKKKFNELAYQKSLKYGLFGIPLAISVIVYSCLPIDAIYSTLPANNLTILFSTSLISFIPMISYHDLLIRLIGSILF
ncbi:MAG: hypothetical protein ACTSRI_11870 [Promethearchaeota archaeon]